MKKDFLDQIFDGGTGNSSKQDAVHHADMTLIEHSEGGAIAVTGQPGERFIRSFDSCASFHPWPAQRIEV